MQFLSLSQGPESLEHQALICRTETIHSLNRQGEGLRRGHVTKSPEGLVRELTGKRLSRGPLVHKPIQNQSGIFRDPRFGSHPGHEWDQGILSIGRSTNQCIKNRPQCFQARRRPPGSIDGQRSRSILSQGCRHRRPYRGMRILGQTLEPGKSPPVVGRTFPCQTSSPHAQAKIDMLTGGIQGGFIQKPAPMKSPKGTQTPLKSGSLLDHCSQGRLCLCITTFIQQSLGHFAMPNVGVIQQSHQLLARGLGKVHPLLRST